MYKNKLTFISLRDKTLTFEITNYQVDIEFSADGTIERSSYSCVNQHNKSKEDAKFLKYFNGRFGNTMAFVFYEMFKADPKAIRIIVDFENAFGVFHLLEMVDDNVGKMVRAYTGRLKVDYEK